MLIHMQEIYLYARSVKDGYQKQQLSTTEITNTIKSIIRKIMRCRSNLDIKVLSGYYDFKNISYKLRKLISLSFETKPNYFLLKKKKTKPNYFRKWYNPHGHINEKLNMSGITLQTWCKNIDQPR